MSEVKVFFTDTPAGLIEALQVVESILPGAQYDFSGLEEIPREYQDALDAVQEVVTADWVRQARVNWVDLQLAKIHIWASQGKLERFYDPHNVCFEPYLRTRYLGSDLNRLLDRWLNVMSDMRGMTDKVEYIRKEMGTVISRRANCIRPGDPHRDETVRDMLRKKYGLD